LARDVQRLPVIPAALAPRNAIFPAQLTGATVVAVSGVSGILWKYSWNEIDLKWNGSRPVPSQRQTADGGRAGPFTDANVGQTGYAWNLLELWNAGASGRSGSGWWYDNNQLYRNTQTQLLTPSPGTISPNPHGHKITYPGLNPIFGNPTNGPNKPIVWMREYLDQTGQSFFLFEGWNTVDIGDH
jgi:hypothetical protein